MKKIVVGASVLLVVSCGLAASFVTLGQSTGTDKSDSTTLTVENGPPDSLRPVQAQDDRGPDRNLVGCLQKVMPKGWKVDTAKLRAPNIQPMGRTPGLGSEMRLSHRSSQASHPDARLALWVMSKPSAPDPQSTDSLVDYLGEGRLGHVYLLAARGIDNPANYWTQYRGDIAVAMGAARRPRGTKTDIVWGKPVDGLQAGIRINAFIEKPTPRLLVVLSVRNVATKPARLLRLETQKDFWCHVPVEVKLHGEVLPYRGLVIEPPPPASIKEFIDLAPGVVDSTEVQMLAADWDLQNLLGAEVTFVYANEQATTIAHPFNEDTRKYTEVVGLWTGTARSGTVTVDGAETGEKSAPKPLGAPEKGDLPTAALRLVQVTVQYSDSKGKDHRFALSEKELEAFSKLYPATPSYRSDQGVKCADAVGLRFKYSDATVVHAHFCGKPTQLHVFRAGGKSEMLTVNKDLHTLLLDAARRRGWQLDTLGNDTQSE